ncbi:MAG: hypothetical protein ACOXZ4_02670 [Sphaerochaetaceae bacterium]
MCSLLIGTSFSCASSLHLEPLYRSYRQNDYEGAYQQVVAKKQEYAETDGPLIWSLDAGILAHWARNYSQSNLHLEAAENLITQLYTQSISANVASFLVNDNTKAYRGEDYEDLYASVFKALNYINLQQGEEALVELRRFQEKQQFLQHKYDRLMDEVQKAGKQASAHNLTKEVSLQFSSSALGNYLALVVAREMGETNQAEFSFNQVQNAFAKQKDLYPFVLPATLTDDVYQPKDGKKRVNFLAFSGLSPIKQEVVERFWIAQNTYVKIALPQLVSRPTTVGSIDVRLSDGSFVALQPLERIGAIALKTFELNRSYIEAKTLLRAFAKATGTVLIDSATAVASDTNDSSDTATAIEIVGSFLSFFSRIYNELSERADVRISHFFPDQGWVGGINLPVGTYDATVIYRDRGGRIIHTDELKQISVDESTIQLWESVCPK